MRRDNWTVVLDEAAVEKALGLCRGSYQRALVEGRENLSGSTLRGRAASYGGRYAVSRRNLLARLEAHGVSVGEERGAHNARLLVIGRVIG